MPPRLKVKARFSSRAARTSVLVAEDEDEEAKRSMAAAAQTFSDTQSLINWRFFNSCTETDFFLFFAFLAFISWGCEVKVGARQRKQELPNSPNYSEDLSERYVSALTSH